MALNNLLLQMQQNETNQRLEDVLEKENKRRSKAGSWSSMGNLLGGGAGLLGAAALGISPVGWGLAGIGALAGAGSFLGGKTGQQWAGGREKQKTNLGQNVDLYTGQKKEFSDRVKNKYNQDVTDFSKNMNNAILTKAVQTGIKSAAFAAMNPNMYTGAANKARGFMGMDSLTMGGEKLAEATAAEVAKAQAGQAEILGGQTSTDLLAQSAGVDPSTLGNIPSNRLPLNTNPSYVPEGYSSFVGPSQNPTIMPQTTLPVSAPTITDTASMASNTAFNPAVGSSTTVANNLPIGNVNPSIINPMPTTVNPVNQNMINAGARADLMRQRGYKLPNTLFNMFQGG